jgi:catechol 2,3-dioxygenase-like lactoylglutathione lyase family enzyme
VSRQDYTEEIAVNPTRRDFLRAAIALPLVPRFAADKALFQVKTLNHLAVWVSDFNRSRAFYRKMLGLVSYAEGETFLQAGPLGRSFIGIGANPKSGFLAHVCFGIDDYRMQDLVDKLHAAGLKTQQVRDEIYFNDPDGAQLQIDSVDYPGTAPRLKSVQKEAAPVFQARTLNHIQIGVADLNRSREFYQRVLGLSVLKHEPNTILLTIDGDQFISLSQSSELRPGVIDSFCVGIEDFNPKVAVSTLSRLAPEVRPTQVKNKLVFFKDPDGVKIQLASTKYRG